MTLSVGAFREFFHAIHGQDPFPWQARLLATVVEDGWPGVIDLPTGSGKTAALDIAVFHLALEQPDSASASRRAPRRIAMVVDRRLVVDQAYERSRRIAEALREAMSGILAEAAARLKEMGGTESPLEVAWLRGGIHRDKSWARTPSQPLLIASTVDQIGSRLLFRGYGVSESMRPIQAGLLANDCLLLLDEVHLSRPFDETLGALERYRSQWAEVHHPAPWTVVRLSATPDRPPDRRTFSLSAEDRSDARLKQRLGASKPANCRLVPVRGEDESRRDTFANACSDEARKLSKDHRCIAVVVNRVDTARRIYRQLESLESGTTAAFETKLMTGRMRPFDRDWLYAGIKSRVLSGRVRSEEDRPLILVATQCVEAGADFDFDAIVTECASLDALRQRAGRVDRLGQYGKAQVVVLVRKDEIDSEERDPIYGSALRRTWEWLSAQEELDFGVERLVLPDNVSELVAPKSSAPVMLPAHLDAWVQTNPPPAADPDVALWLHGPSAGAADVQIIWRADTNEAALEAAATDDDAKDREDARERIVLAVAVVPPSSAEALSVPFVAARAWLARRASSEAEIRVSDVELSTSEAEERSQRGGDRFRRALRWRGEDESRSIHPDDLRPGDTIVVPVEYGGIGRHFTWDPQATSPVLDVGDLVQGRTGRRDVLRLSERNLKQLGFDGHVPAEPPEEATPQDERDHFTTWLSELPPELERVPPQAKEALREIIERLAQAAARGRLRVLAVSPPAPTRVLVGAVRRNVASAEVTTEPETSSFTASEVQLTDHCDGVGQQARRFGKVCALPKEVRDDIELAAQLHDVGKADPRFQAWLRGGDRITAASETVLLAKSAIPQNDAMSRQRARVVSGYPRGTRHEMLSVALVAGSPVLASKASDVDLVLHLIASHHGYARPFAPAVLDPENIGVRLQHGDEFFEASTQHQLARLDSGIADRFWRLIRRYGWFGLAWLEAILRLADHRRSEIEVADGGGL